MAQQTPTRISNFGRRGGVTDISGVVTPVTFGAFNWPAQNLAIIQALNLPFPYTVNRVYWYNGTAASGSNWDMGIYDATFTRLYHTASTAASGNSVMQYVTLGTALQLTPGLYYLAIANDNATTTSRGYGVTTITTNEGRIGGLLQQTSAFALPTTLTPAQWASTGLQVMGIARSTSGA